MVARAAVELKAGAQLPGDHSRELQSLMLPAAPVADAAPLPFHLGYGNPLAHDVAAGTVITRAMVTPPPDSMLWALRKEQDVHFLGADGRDD